MNRTYRSVWSDAGQSYVAVPEFARAHGKRSSIVAAVCAAALLAGGPAHALAPDALPTGGVVKAGQAEIGQSGAAMTIRQTTQNVAIDWPSYSIGEKASVNYVQPNAAAIALNRVVGQDPSQILGSLTANGQVFIVNPAGVLFGKGAQVNAQGILASTRDIDVADFMAGNYRFAGSGKGTVDNAGKLIAGKGGYVALIGAQVGNTGEIHAPLGDVRLAAADRVTVTLDNGSLAGFTVGRGTLDALAENGGLIRADGGRVYLTADAADSLAKAVVNNTGIIEARGVEERNGTIVLLADMAVGTANIAGTLDASRSDGAKGGFVETSGHKVKIADGTRVKANRWLIDPADFTIAATGGDISGATLSANLATADVEIQSSSGGAAGNGDIHVNDAVSWNAKTLTLTAARDININAVMTAGGTSRLVMNTATANGADAGVADGVVKVGFNPAGGFKGRVDFPGRTGTGFLTINGAGYTVIDALGSAGSVTAADLQGMNGNLAGNYALGGDIDASATRNWNGGVGFAPVGGYFTGQFNGLGHVVSNLFINVNNSGSTADDIGLFGSTSTSTVLRNVGLENADVRSWVTTSISFGTAIGALAGWGQAANSYSTGSVKGDGSSYAGGLIGESSASVVVSDSYSTAVVNGRGDAAGGLIGEVHSGTVSDSYATGDVTGRWGVGGLIGLIGSYGTSTTVIRSHASGRVTSTASAGGLVGLGGAKTVTITDSYATGNVVGNAAAGGLIGSLLGNAIMYVSNWSISRSYASGNVTATAVAGRAGGLIGSMNKVPGYTASIADSYASGAVTGGDGVGGLIGAVEKSGANVGAVPYTLTRSYATGRVTGAANTGGLVGFQGASTTLDAATGIWDAQTTGQTVSAGNATGKTSAEMKQLATFAGWDIDAAGGTGKVWRIYEGDSTPLLRGFLAPATVASATPVIKPADGSAYDGAASAFSVPGADSSRLRYGGNGVGASAAGSHDLRVYSGQQGYDLIGVRNTTLTLTRAAAPAATPVTAAAQTPAYSGALVAASQPIAAGGAAQSTAGAIPAGRGAQLPPQAAPVAAQDGVPASTPAAVTLLADAGGLPLVSMQIIDAGLRLPEPGPFDLVRREDNP